MPLSPVPPTSRAPTSLQRSGLFLARSPRAVMALAATPGALEESRGSRREGRRARLEGERPCRTSTWETMAAPSAWSLGWGEERRERRAAWWAADCREEDSWLAHIGSE